MKSMKNIEQHSELKCGMEQVINLLRGIGCGLTSVLGTLQNGGKENQRRVGGEEDCLKMVIIGRKSEGWDDDTCNNHPRFFCSRVQVCEEVN